MESPTLGAGVNGCVLEWKLTYHDNLDNLDKAVVAYSYVYKPYVVAITTGIKAEETFFDSHRIEHISWIAGIHNVVSEATSGQRYARYGASARTGNKGFMPFLTSGNLDGINGSRATGSHFGVKDGASPIAGANTLNAYFASTNTSYDYFYADQSTNNNNQSAWDWHVDSGSQSMTTTESSTSSVNKAVHVYSDISRNPSRLHGNCCVWKSYINNSVGGIYIDTSRYTNLSQVPNLGIGLRITRSAGADNGSWYVADCTDTSLLAADYYGDSNNNQWNDQMTNIWNNQNYFIARAGDKNSTVSHGAWCETKYAGTWPHALDTTNTVTTKTYKVRMTTYAHNGKDATLGSSVMQLQATQYNKANLRAAVYNAEREFSRLGVYDINYNSHYYKYEGAYKAFIEAYKSAYASLIYVDMAPTSNPNTLATNLNNALAALKNDDGTGTDTCRKKGTAYQYNVGVIRNEDGTYRIVPIPGATQVEKTFNLRDKVTFTADTYIGYTFLGMYKMESKFTLEEFYDEAYDVIAVPEQTHSENRKNVRVSQDSSARTTSLTTLDSISTSTEVAEFNGSTVTYNYAYDTDITYVYFYEINNNDVIFGNEFDFDKFRWVGAHQGTKVADHVNNTLTLNSTSTANDAYTTAYDGNQKGYMTLVPGRVYEYSCTVKNNTSSNTTGNMFLFTFPTAPAISGVSIGADRVDFTSASVYLGANETGEVKGTLTIPEGRPYATIRVGSYTPDTSVTFSNIVVRDITTFTTPLLTNAVTVPNPTYKTGTPGASITGFPTITRPGYVLAGWSTVREANGNGAAANMVTSVAVPSNGNETLYPVWQTNVIYSANGGTYRKSSDPMQTSYQVEGRWNVAIGTSVPVSNRVVQGQTGWDSVDVNYSYVPYRLGYNFKGWLANSVDPAVNGKVYWPTDPVVTNANVEFTAQWEEAPAVTLNTTSRITSSNNDGERAFYPGQVHFYKYTPATNQYASAYTYNSEGDLEMQAFDGSLSFITENDNHEYSYGIQDIVDTDPMITMSLTAGNTYYAGIGMHSITGTTAGGTNFRIQEHTVKYTLLPNGGIINGSQETQYATGYSNIDTVLPSTGELYGYNFAGWKSNEVPAVSYEAGVNIPGVDNYNRLNGYTASLVREIILTAQWTPKPFNVTYEQNIPAGATPTSASPMPSGSVFRYDNEGTVSEIVPSMDGYTLKGWATTAEKVEGEKLYQKNEVIAASTINGFFDANNGGDIKLYARWSPNLIIVRFKPGAGTGTEFTQNFWYDQEQAIATQNFDPEKYSVGFYEVGTTEAIETLKADLEFDGWQDVQTGTPNFTYANGATIKNPNGVTGTSDTVGTETILYAKWKGGASTVTTPVWVSAEDTHVLAGWSVNSDASTVDYAVGEAFAPKGDMKLYAVWYPVDTAENVIVDFKQYEENATVVTGVEFTNGDLTEYTEIKSETAYPVYDIVEYNAAVQRYENAREALKKNATAANNREYYDAIKAVEAYATNPPATKDPITSYLTQFEIKYAEGVTGKVPAGKYSLPDMNLNHYTTADLDAVLQAYTDAKGVENMLNQSVINRSVVTYATKYANKQDLNTKPVYNMYDTVDKIEESGLIESEDITAMNYVYTGKGNYTYYCYTNSTNPTILLTVDDDKVDNRYCYPTTFDSNATKVTTTKGASAAMPEYDSVSDGLAKSKYDAYLAKGIGSTAEGKALDTSYYYQKAKVELNPDFSAASDKATVAYTFSAYDDAYAPTAADINYADASRLASGAEKGNVANIPNTDNAVTPENTITIIIDYHAGEGFDVTGQQVQDDEWLKQYHLARSSGGASNWELPVSGDSVYTVYDETYGQTDYGSFTYTFVVGAENDFANCVLASSDVNDIIGIVKENYDAMKSVAFDGAQEIWKWAYDKNDGNLYKYMCTHEAGTGLGFKAWPNTNWSFNYYPLSGAYTYVHLVDRWGNTVDKVIQVPNLDGSATQLHANAAGQVEAIEMGGSGIDTMSFSAQSFEIIAEGNSSFDGETYTTEGNTIKVYTGEANKKYSLEANDVATNKTTMDVTTDAEGYLTITVEDKDFDKQGAYTFTLNGKEINLYAEVEKNIVSAEDVAVEEGQRATVEIVTTSKVTSVQLVSAEGSTTTATEYSEDGNGNRVWTISKNKAAGEYEYTVRYKTNGGWITEGETVKITVTKPEIFVGAVTNVEYTPSESTRNEFMFTVTGRPDKIQVIEPDGGTRTYDRYHVKVVIVSYDEEGNAVSAMSRELSYEVWTIEMNVPAEKELTAIARYGREWSRNAPYTYTVVLATPEYDDAVYEMKLAAEEGEQGRVEATVVTGLDVNGVRFIMDNGSTATYYNATEADGKLTYIGTAWINHRGDNVIVVKIRVNNAWLNAGELNYYAI